MPLRRLVRRLPAIKRAWIAVNVKWARWKYGQLTRRKSRLIFKLLEDIEAANKNPVFIKVGANDGVTGDPCGKHFLENLAWTGLLIEPVPYLSGRLQEIYADRSRFRFSQVAVGRHPGETDFHFVDQTARQSLPGLPDWYDQLGSFSRQHILNHLEGQLEPFIRTTKVKVDSLNNLLEQQRWEQIDFLHVDTEGSDLLVVENFDFTKFRPKGVLIEHKHLSEIDRDSLLRLLVNHGYSVESIDGDFVALQKPK